MMTMTDMNKLRLERDSLGRLALLPLHPEGGSAAPEPVVPVRVWIDDLQALPEASRRVLTEVLAVRDFAPTLLALHKVSSFGVPSTWSVSTDRGDTSFVLKAEEDIRRLEDGALLIASAAGVQFRVPDPAALDRHSRKLLERFL
jgi:hypothetical protein